MKGLKDKNVIVTGGTSGIGQAIATRLAAEGAHVAINYRRDPGEAQATDEMVHRAIENCVNEIAAHGVNHTLVQADVTSETDIKKMVAETTAVLGGVDILINNAGIQIAADSHEMTSEQFDKVMAVNIRGAFLAAREAINHFLAEKKPGIIINISSVHQRIPKPRYLGYAISKGGMMNLTRTLALEYAGRSIRVNGVAPGATVTPINKGWINDEDKREAVTSHIPMGRAGSAAEMAGAVAFLCSDEAAYITGQTLFVDGGLTLYPDFRTPWSSE